MQRWQRWCLLLAMLFWSARPGDCLNLIGPEIVFDPSNYASNLMQQFEAIKQTIGQATMIANQYTQIEHEVQSLIYQAQNLQKNPLQLLSQLKSLWNQYNNILADAEGLSYNLAQAGAAFQVSYPAFAGTQTGASIAAIGAASDRMLPTTRGASATAVRSQ